ncbi:MAG: maltose alpha-D-glucosyltransferase, partial [Pararhizobium sp.]
AVREAYGFAASRQVMIPDTTTPGLLVMVHELPDGRGTQVTALNFGDTALEEVIVLPNVTPGPVVDMIGETIEGDLQEDGALTISLEPYEGLALRIVGTLPVLA